MNKTKQNPLWSYRLPSDIALDEEFSADYKAFRYQLLIDKMPLITRVAISVFVLFIFFDLSYLPADAYQITIPLRLGMIALFIAMKNIAQKQAWSLRTMEFAACGVYLLSGFAIMMVIYQSILQGLNLPYDGILLLIVFGYFVLGLSVFNITVASIILSISYLSLEIYMQFPQERVLLSAFFLFNFNSLGILACYMQNQSQRAIFWHERQAAKRQRQDQQEIEEKSRLVATASHDLRQPLHAMNLMLDVLQERLHGRETYSFTEKIKGSLKQVNKLLDSLLNYSQLETGVLDVKKQNVRLSDLLSELVEEEAARAKNQGLAMSVDCDISLTVFTDPVLLRRILRNLVENVFDHANAKMLRFQAASKDETVVLEIIDDGVGIARDQVDSIFGEFRKGCSSKTGLGLGLAIVRQLSDFIDAPMSLESKPDRGCAFTLQLEKAAVPAASEGGQKPRQFDFSGLNVLIAEDDLVIRQSMSELLLSWGANVEAVASLSQLNAKPNIAAVDLIVSDYHLDEGDIGVSVIEKVRAIANERTPALLITADTSVDEDTLIVQGVDLSDIILMHKPIHPAKMKIAVGMLLNNNT